ncbi:hypothetical protein CIRG_02636 [Coccidioides immitis RMSCC 2394]|uniref:Uncharacterized protein n=1 Tax=Coccidioides immitis RMSCC 2394 TaxID=404692 RepID=A0A0J6Y7C2_COCIT|nr:hypothetical protein CIRG_02636 [Coccidioides immitis RMSCC 2394]
MTIRKKHDIVFTALPSVESTDGELQLVVNGEAVRKIAEPVELSKAKCLRSGGRPVGNNDGKVIETLTRWFLRNALAPTITVVAITDTRRGGPGLTRPIDAISDYAPVQQDAPVGARGEPHHRGPQLGSSGGATRDANTLNNAIATKEGGESLHEASISKGPQVD